MKNNKLKIFIALLIMNSISGLSTAHANITDEPHIDENNILTVAGQTETGNTSVTLELYESAANMENIDLNNLSDLFYYLREIESNSSGAYEFAIPVKGCDKQFKLRIREGKGAVSERTVNFENNMAAEALDDLKAADTADEVKAATDKFLSAVDFSFDLYNNNKTAIENSTLLYNIISSADDADIASQDSFSALAEYATVLYSLANAADINEFKTIFNSYSDVIFTYEPEVGSLFNNTQCTGDSIKADIIQRLYNKKQSNGEVFENKSQFNGLLQESVILSCCENNRGYDAFDAIIDVLAKIYKSDTAFMNSYNRYQSFAPARQNETALEIMGHSFLNTAEVKDTIISATALSSRPDTGGGGGGGSSSGSGGSGLGGFRVVTGSESYDSEVNNSSISANIPQKKNINVEFNDLDNVAWAKDSILELASREIINGKAENAFAPLDSITREEFIKMLVVSLGISTSGSKCTFSDVSENAWYYEYVAAGYANGIINGVDDTNFGQGRPVSRQEIAAMVARAMKKTGFDMPVHENINFADDSRIADYAKESIYSLKVLGVVNGKENNMFDPSGSATRAEAAKIISSMISQLEKAD